MDRSTYTYYERGKTSPDTQTLRILAELYGISPEIFLFPEKYADMKPDRPVRALLQTIQAE